MTSSRSAARGGIKSNPDLLSVSFNQDSTCIATGTRRGYTITNCDPFGKVYGRSDGATSIVEMLFCTSLVALVGAGDRPASSTRRLQIVNTKRQSTICELTFPTTILAVKLNRRRLVVVLEERIYLYDISNMKLLHEIETSANPQAICALSPSSENSYLAYPSPLPSPATPFSTTPPASSSGASNPSGDVLLFDAVSLSVTNIIQAHKAPVAHVVLNSAGTLLATASDKGTVIRVFSVPNGDKVHEFRRGSYPARIFSIAFNAASTLLCVSSDTETVHIFKLVSGAGGAGRGKGVGGAASGAPDWDEQDRFGSAGSSGAGGRNGGGGDGAPPGGYDALIESKRTANQGGVGGTLRKKSLSLGRNLAGSVGGLLPGAVTGMWDPQRDFAYLKVPTSGVKSVVALSGSSPQVMVVTSEGVFYSYAIDLENGGECVLQKSYSLLDGIGDDSNGSPMGD
ncbi:putative phosphoinositide binding protein [Rhodotorula diobovata]|uniref:Autophagy-related protein 18 n=1 Tax=Rhodotorula diobovata TaxID=5288 RepID=A0A5C5G4T1_9BASI|nr:putative phosphoinositide binding protein [Rhodotorula diobovata]